MENFPAQSDDDERASETFHEKGSPVNEVVMEWIVKALGSESEISWKYQSMCLN